MIPATKTDTDVVESARRACAAKGKLRWAMLGYAVALIGLSGYCTIRGALKIENLDTREMGFVYGVALAVVWTSFGLAGSLCLGKFLVGFNRDIRLHKLLKCYHDRLRDLGQLPG